MLEKNTKLEEKIKALKEQIEPDDEMDQLVTLMAEKNKSYSRTAQGAIPKVSTKKICEVCRLVCETEKKYQNHVKSHTSDGDWMCNKSDFKTNTKSNLDIHISTFVHEVYDERRTPKHTCANFDLKTNTKTALDTHICRAKHPERTDNVFKNVSCAVCNGTFGNKTELNAHKIKSHKSWKLCNKFFSSDPNVKCQHKPCNYSHVQPSADMHRCYNCGREFPDLEILMLHMKSLHNAICRLFQTGVCDRDQESCWFNHHTKNLHKV